MGSVKARYAVTRWSSPGEWSIELVANDYAPQPGSPAAVFDSFTEAREWLTDQTRAWVEGFRDDSVEIRALRKADVPVAATFDRAIAAQEKGAGE